MKYKLGWIFASLFLICLGVAVAASDVQDTIKIKMVSYNFGPAQPYEAFIIEASHKYNFEPELIAAVITHESCVRWTPDGKFCTLVSPIVIGGAGEIGLMQIKRDTCIGYFSGQTCDNLRDPGINIEVSTFYLRKLVNARYGNLNVGLSNYNSGPNTTAYIAKYVNHVNSIYTIYKSQRKFIEITRGR